MKPETSKPLDREGILAAIRLAAKEAAGERPAYKSFLARSKISNSRFSKHFIGWNQALLEAGFDFDPRGGDGIDPERLLVDWGRVARKLGRVPVSAYYVVHGKYSVDTLRARFGAWAKMPVAFRSFADGKKEWADVAALCNARPAKRGRRFRAAHERHLRQMRMRLRPRPGANKAALAAARRAAPAAAKTATPLPGRPIYGEPIHVQGMSNAPVNETGVVLLFGKLAWDLGFQVEFMRTAFPDCQARRRVGPGQWQDVAIEFEYESRNFSLHGHDPKGCDLIVCWHHNWADCPKNLEVIALKDELQRLYPINPTDHAATGSNGCPQPPRALKAQLKLASPA